MRAAAALVLLMCAPGLGGCWFAAHLHLGDLAQDPDLSRYIL